MAPPDIAPSDHMTAEHVHHLPAGRPFAEDLARGVLALTDGPQDLADSVILLPNRRLASAVRTAFLQLANGDAQLLPRMMSIGDVDEDDAELVIAGWDVDDLPPVIDPLERLLYLSNAIKAFASASMGDELGQMSLGEMMSLARALCTFIDQVETAGCDLGKLDELADGAHAKHWNTILTFLKIITEHWPGILDEKNRSDPVVWRNAAIRARAKAWAVAPPKGVIVVAGSTGSVPATQDLMKAVITLDRGHLVLPGLDTGMDEDDWHSLADDEDETLVAHPQYPLRQLLDALDVDRAEVGLWCGTAAAEDGYDAAATGRLALLREIMRPAQQTHRWRRIPEQQIITQESIAGLELAVCYDQRQEADVIALAMREVLETPAKTAALVTADFKLAEMVRDALLRWGVHVVPSAGRRMLDTPPAQFMRLVLDAWMDDFSPISLLAMARHHLAAGGMTKPEFRAMIRRLELNVLRGMRRSSHAGKNGLDVLRAAAKSHHDDALVAFIDHHLIAPLQPFLEMATHTVTDFAKMADIHGRVVEAMAATPDDDGATSLAPWQGQDGYRLGQFLHKISLYGHTVPVDAAGYQSALISLMSAEMIYPDEVGHPRLSILGTVEARMHAADLVILGGLNEGTSPAAPPPDPWMNQRMRLELGLPHAHWRVGHAAHDAMMAMARPRVLMTRAERDDGSPAAPSRWIQRLNAVMDVANMNIPSRPDLLHYADMLNQYDGPVRPVPQPNPTPPVDMRPRKFSATELDTLLKDPYAIYARRILNLKALPDLEEPMGAADRGNLFHHILYRFIDSFPDGALPEDALEKLMAIGREEFSKFDDLKVNVFWWQRFKHLAAWFIDHEVVWRKNLARSFAEIRGEMVMTTAMGDVTLTAKADRIDITKDGKVRIVDYKTGQPPSKTSVQNGRALQLRMEALLIGANGYPTIDTALLRDDQAELIDGLSYWYISGKRGAAGETKPVLPKDEDVISESRAGILKLLDEFADPGQGYLSEPLASEANAYSDYKHLARVQEWINISDEAGGHDDG